MKLARSRSETNFFERKLNEMLAGKAPFESMIVDAPCGMGKGC